MSGQELVKHLERMKIQLPEPRIDTKPIFEVLTNRMCFNDSITDEQITKLNQILSKIADYYIHINLQN